MKELINYVEWENRDECGVFVVGYFFGVVIFYMVVCEVLYLFCGVIMLDLLFVVGFMSYFFCFVKKILLINKFILVKFVEICNICWLVNIDLDVYFYGKVLFCNMDK